LLVKFRNRDVFNGDTALDAFDDSVVVPQVGLNAAADGCQFGQLLVAGLVQNGDSESGDQVRCDVDQRKANDRDEGGQLETASVIFFEKSNLVESRVFSVEDSKLANSVGEFQTAKVLQIILKS
jgi:hypothetical protein